MKTYLEAVEHILGTGLDRQSVQKYDFSADTLSALENFAENYSKARDVRPGDDHKITCYLPFPDILSGNFRSYHTSGSLEGHWPDFAELANMLMLCERVIIHDHLAHYASSAITGYVEEYRYDGLRNWLLALADWKPLILKDIICILPQDLRCSGLFQTLWDEGEISGLASEVYYAINQDAGNISSGSEAEELLADFMEIEDYLTSLSIPVDKGGRFAPFFNDLNAFWLHEALIEASFDLFRLKAFLKGDMQSFPKDKNSSGNIARLVLNAPLMFPSYNPPEICRLRLEDQDFNSIREEVKLAVRKFSENSAFLLSPANDFQQYLNSLQNTLNLKIEKFTTPSLSIGTPLKQVTIGFAGMISGKGYVDYLTTPFTALRSILNNLPVKAQLPGSCSYLYLSVKDKSS